jgi:tRNA1Val (adenine37-N6)-methyltransferase
VTFDRPAPGVVVAQPARGFRYGSDAMWLTGFALECRPDPATALDLGTGSGVVAMLLAARGIRTVGVELRAEWEPLWRETLARSDPLPVELRRGDIRGDLGGPYDLVVANPPFFASDRGPVAPDPWKAAARTESTATLAEFVRAGLAVLAEGGRMALVAPREREDEVVRVAGGCRLVRVGARRTLFCLGSGEGGVRAVDEGSEIVRAWVRAATLADGG